MIAYWSTNPLPAEVDIVSISGSAREGESEYPPSEWLADWPIPVLVDDDTVVWDSRRIVRYLYSTYGGSDRARSIDELKDAPGGERKLSGTSSA